MIKILIADDLSTRTIDKLNEIPEFEIIEKTNLSLEKLATEIKNVEAVVLNGTTLLTSAILKNAVNLKIIVLTGSGSDHAHTEMARGKNIEVRCVPLLSSATAENQERNGMDVIVILKDFFNV
jgi:D-3-phosphoglycerate dehydrogenase